MKKKYTIYKDDRATSGMMRIGITTPNGRGMGCFECGRSFKEDEKILRIGFRFLAPREICSGCAFNKLSEAVNALGNIYEPDYEEKERKQEYLKAQRVDRREREKLSPDDIPF